MTLPFSESPSVVSQSPPAGLPQSFAHGSSQHSASLQSKTPGVYRLWFVLLLLGPLPLLLKLGHYLWTREQYQFYPVLLLGAAFCGWERWSESSRSRTGKPREAWVALAVALLAIVAGNLLFIRLTAGLATIILLAGIALRIGGWPLIRTMLPIGVLLLTVVPPPFKQQQLITLKLQQFAVVWSGHLLDLLHVPQVRGGDVLEIPGRQLLIEEACSGINSLMSVLAFTVLWGVWKRRSAWRIALLLPAAIMFVVAGNILRITMDAWLKVRWNIDVLSGTPHELLGLVLFALCLEMTLSFDVLLGLFLPRNATSPAPARVVVAPTEMPGARLPKLRLGRVDWTIAIVFLLIGVWSQARVGSAWASARLGAAARFDLPRTLAGWEKSSNDVSIVERPQTEGAQSAIWQYRRGGLIASVAIDYPFNGYHELTICYGVSGWTLHNRIDQPGETRVDMSRPPGLTALLRFAAIDEQGDWVSASPIEAQTGMLAEFARAAEVSRKSASYQVQTLVQSYNALSEEQRVAVENLFQAARDSLRVELLTQLGQAPQPAPQSSSGAATP